MNKRQAAAYAKSTGLDAAELEKIVVQDTESGNVPLEERGQLFSVPGNEKKKVFISAVDMAFIEKLRLLPAATRIRIMRLSDIELADYLKKEREYMRAWLLQLLSVQWYWRATGDKAELEGGCIGGTELGQAELIKVVRKGSKLSRQDMQVIVDWFLSDRSEVYRKDGNW